MKLNNVNLNASYGDINITMSYFDGSETISVNASLNKGDRSLSINRNYKPDGTFTPEMSSLDAPFDEKFNAEVSALVAKMFVMIEE